MLWIFGKVILVKKRLLKNKRCGMTSHIDAERPNWAERVFRGYININWKKKTFVSRKVFFNLTLKILDFAYTLIFDPKSTFSLGKNSISWSPKKSRCIHKWPVTCLTVTKKGIGTTLMKSQNFTKLWIFWSQNHHFAENRCFGLIWLCWGAKTETSKSLKTSFIVLSSS